MRGAGEGLRDTRCGAEGFCDSFLGVMVHLEGTRAIARLGDSSEVGPGVGQGPPQEWCGALGAHVEQGVISPCPAGHGALSGPGTLWGALGCPRSCCRRWTLSRAGPALEQPPRAGSIRVGRQHRKDCRWEPGTILHWTKQLLILFLCRGRSVPYNSQGGSYRRETSGTEKEKAVPSPAAGGRQGWRMSYGQRLREFNLCGLESQCWRGNRITLYKYLKGSCVRKGKKVTHAAAVGGT